MFLYNNVVDTSTSHKHVLDVDRWALCDHSPNLEHCWTGTCPYLFQDMSAGKEKGLVRLISRVSWNQYDEG